jgi:hypothetical protein
VTSKSSLDQGTVLRWRDLSAGTRESLAGKLKGLWGASTDEEAFNALSADKQQALLLLMNKLISKNLWDHVRRIENAYGLYGVGIDFIAWPGIESALSRRHDFTRRFAKRKTVSGGFYEKGRKEAALHFLYQGEPRLWHVHFDLYSPVESISSALRHLRHEYIGKLTPDWLMIRNALKRRGD